MTPFTEQIARAGRQLDKVIVALQLTSKSANEGELGQAYANAFDLANEAEKFTLLARQLPAFTGSPNAHDEMNGLIACIMPIAVGYTSQGWLGIRIPALLPKKAKGTTDYIRLSLYLALSNFFKDKPRIRFDECIIIFRHRYDKKRPERWARDHDNIEINAVVDAVALFVLADDTAYLCDHFYCSVMSDHDETEVYIIPKDQFLVWWKIVGHSPYPTPKLI